MSLSPIQTGRPHTKKNMPTSNLLLSLADAVSGSAGTAISTAATYPLDLVGTRLKVQRQLRAQGSVADDEAYGGVSDALQAIPRREGGPSALFAGLGADAARSAADSFLFFLFYSWFRARRLRSHGARKSGSGGGASSYLFGAVEELAIGAAAGACARLFTTPVSNVVARAQTENLVHGDTGREGSASSLSSPSSSSPPQRRGLGEIFAEIRRQKGILGLWAGYSASLVLTMNPSITFFLQRTLEKNFTSRWGGDNFALPGVTFLLAAVSKAVATTITYPFQTAKARVQVSEPSPVESDEDPSRMHDSDGGMEVPARGIDSGKTESDEQETIFSTVKKIGQEEGPRALYDGLGGELLKAFFGHGITMVMKDLMHKLLFQLCFAILAMLKRRPRVWPSSLRAVVKAVGGSSRNRRGSVAIKDDRTWGGGTGFLELDRAATWRILERNRRRIGGGNFGPSS